MTKCLTIPRLAAIINLVLQCILVFPVFIMIAVCLDALRDLNSVNFVIGNSSTGVFKIVGIKKTHHDLQFFAFMLFTTASLILAVILSLYAAYKLLAATKPGILFSEKKKNIGKYKSAIGIIAALTIIVAAGYIYEEAYAFAMLHFIPLPLQFIGLITLYFQLRNGDNSKGLEAQFEKAWEVTVLHV